MSKANCTVILSSGETIEAEVTELQFEHNNVQEETYVGCDWGFGQSESVITLTANVKEIVKKDLLTLITSNISDGAITQAYVNEQLMAGKEKCMCYSERDACAKESSVEGSWEGKDLARRMREKSLDEDTRLLRKYNVVDKDGVLTEKGKELLINLVFDNNKEKVVEVLKEEEAEYKKLVERQA